MTGTIPIWSDPDPPGRVPEGRDPVARRQRGGGPQAGGSLCASPKLRLFWLASWLPGSLFDPLSQLYFKLPGFLRK